jgi:hypothetical protein
LNNLKKGRFYFFIFVLKFENTNKMNLQYISDNKGKTTGVFIPINDWEYLKNKYKEIDQEEKHSFEVPDWHKEIVLQRLEEYRKDQDRVLDWENVRKEIEGKYGF